MSSVQVIILAAGQSSRLYPITLNCPKSLLPFGNEPLLVRTIRQLHNAGLTSIRVVVGYLHQQIRAALEDFKDSIEFIYNKDYASDTNSLSLYLSLQKLNSSAALVIEADVVLSDACWAIIQEVCTLKPSVWFTHGLFQAHQVGGIIKSNDAGKIVDMKILPQFDSNYSHYSKNLGIVYIGYNEIICYKKILQEAVTKSSAAYYMEHWIQHLPHLACEERNLFPYPAGSFNTLEELEYCRRYLL